MDEGGVHFNGTLKDSGMNGSAAFNGSAIADDGTPYTVSLSGQWTGTKK
jgi:hypothetical protein